jgi:hypothetical protein
MMRFIKIFPILFVIAAIGLIVSCEDETTNPLDQVPTMPSQSTMLIDFDEFPDTAMVENIDFPLATKMNWGWAATNVKVWNSILTLNLVIPVAAFREAFNHQPVLQSDGSWLWQYDISVEEENYTAKLYGKTVTEGVDWKMLLSKSGAYTDFEWFTGISNLPATEGSWTLNKNPESPSPFLLIEWQRNLQEETASVKYSLLTTSLTQNESYIFYGKTNEVPMNRFYQIYNAEDENLVDIQWSYESHFGRVMDMLHFQDKNWHCWDDKLDDTECTE